MVSVQGSSVLGVIFTLVVIAILIFNVIFVNGARRLGSATNLSSTAGTVIFWVDIILIVLLGIYLIYNLYVIFTSHEQRTAVEEVITRTRKDVPEGTTVTRITVPSVPATTPRQVSPQLQKLFANAPAPATVQVQRLNIPAATTRTVLSTA